MIHPQSSRMENQTHTEPSVQSHEPSTSWRRQALNACELCRQRKSKCNEERPRCGRCERLRLPCVYSGSGTKRDTSLFQIQETLSRVESKLDGLSEVTWRLHSHVPRASNIQDSWDLLPETFQSYSLVTSGPAHEYRTATHRSSAAAAYGLPVHPPPQTSPSLDSTQNLNDQDFVLAIPFRHTTAPQNILSWPCVQKTPVTPDLRYALRLELARSKPSRSTSPPICLKAGVDAVLWVERMTLPQIRLLSRRYFEDLCPQAPVITLKYFQEQILGPVLHEGFGSDLQTCLLLLVCALGSLSAVDKDDIEWQTGQNNPQASGIKNASGIGLSFFNLANEILRSQPELTWKSCQAHLLVGIYQSHQMRLYEHWQAVNQASMSIMILLQNTSHLSNLQSRIYWVAYLQESQILAELELPPSGISRYENFVPFPFQEIDSESKSDRDDEFIFLAQISVRRLLNRVHFNIYNNIDETISTTLESPSLDHPSNTSMMNISPSMIHELDHQLETWRSHLPPRLLFESIDSIPPWDHTSLIERKQRSGTDKLLGFTKARYCAGKAIIHRFFVYKILHSPESSITEQDIHGASICLKAAFNGVLAAGILSDSFVSIQSPINPCRSFFATAMLLKLVSMSRHSSSVLPEGWEIISQIQQRLEIEIAPISPIVAEDMRILRRVDDLIVNPHNTIHNIQLWNC